MANRKNDMSATEKTSRRSPADKAAARRQPSVASATEHRIRSENFLSDVEATASWVSSAVITMLHDADEDLDTSDRRFRQGVQSCFHRVLVLLASKKEKIVFLNEAVPGFTVLSIKKEGWGDKPSTPAEPPVSVPTPELDEDRADAVNRIISAYVQRTGKRVLMVEGRDIVLIMFPVADLRRNLEEMGFTWAD